MKTNTIKIDVDLKKKEMHVDPHPFYVHTSNSEEVQWVLSPTARNANVNHFTVTFTGESPFNQAEFDDQRDHSGCASVKPDDKLYTATLTVPGVGTCMIQGGVKP